MASTKPKTSPKKSPSGLVGSSKTKLNKKQLGGIIVALIVVGVGIKLVSNAAISTCVQGTFRQGNSGQCVKNIQILANHKIRNAPAFYSNLAPLAQDGSFGLKTKIGIVAIQKQFKLTQDGVVGPASWKVLCSSATIQFAGGPFSSAELAAAKGSGCPGL